MRLIEAEVRKLNRPLTWCLMICAAVFVVLLASGSARNAQLAVQSSSRQGVDGCEQLVRQAGQQLSATQCAAAQAAQQQRNAEKAAADRASARNVTRALSPAAAGAEAAGLIASMPGALLIGLLAGGHVGGEWSGRTLKNLLAQHGRRGEVLAAKAASLWLASVGLLAVTWATLAVAGPVLAKANGLPASTLSVLDALRSSGSHIARAALVLAFFVLLGILAAVVTRGTVGTISAAVGGVFALLAIGSLPTLGEFTPASFVEGWMGFAGPAKQSSTLPDNFWSRFTDSSGTVPSHGFGLAGLSVTVLICGALAWGVFRRVDIV
jgi:ABC-type transport system involved in multi-copper enzyme maturation permease subunit